MLEGFRYKQFKELYQKEKYNQAINLIEKALLTTNLLKYKRLVVRMLNIDIYQKKEKPFRTMDLLDQLHEDGLKQLVSKYLIKYNKCLKYQNFLYGQIILDLLLELVNLGYLKLTEIPNTNYFHDYIINQYQELNYIKSIKEDLENNTSCVLTKSLATERLEILKKLLKEESSLKFFEIQDNKGQHLVIHKVLHEKIDYNEYKNKAKEAKREKNYREALTYNLKLLEVKHIPFASIYAHIGLLYLKLHNNKEAIKYLTIATYHPLENYFDFNKVIEDKLNFEFNEKQHLPTFNLEEFNREDISKKYANLIIKLNESKDNLETFSLNNNLSHEDLLILKIIIARHYYANNFSKQADNLLKNVEKDIDNNCYITDLIKETRQNKIFYQNKKEYQQILRLNL